MRRWHGLWVVPALVLVGACGAQRDVEDRDDGVAGDAAEPEAGEGAQADDEPLREVSCIDQSIATLMLFDEAAPSAIMDETRAGDGFETLIDATGGGLTPTHSFVYVALTEDGMEQVDLGDEDAFESADWDLGFRRYVVRLNSGVSGPSDVTAARTAPETDFAALDEVPEDLEYRTEQYFNDSCDFVSDGSGIGGPATALASFWSYSGCLKMTGNVYVLDLDDGRSVKLEVLSYYNEESQAVCDETGEVPSPSGAGNLRLRWAFL